MEHKLRYANYYDIDVVNGPGTRVTLFVTGCELACKGCYNRSIRKLESGHLFDQEMEDKVIADLNSTEIPRRGISLLGGDPLHPENVSGILKLVERIKKDAPTKDIWLWTGYQLEELTEAQTKITELVNVVVDGPFVQEKADPNLIWMGSANQTIHKLR